MATVDTWLEKLDELVGRIGQYYARSESRGRAKEYLQALLSPVERKNGWQLAEALGYRTPDALQQFLNRSPWDPDLVRDEARRYVVEHLGDGEAVLVVDESGFLKKGRHSAGVQRQYSGTAGRVENCQVGVFLTYASRHGATFLDRELYLPESWTADAERCRAAGVPAAVEFATKPALGQRMLERALDDGVPAAWLTADCVYGDDPAFRATAEERALRYVLAVSGKFRVWQDCRKVAVSSLLAELPDEGWTRLSAGAGAKGPRLYDWRLVPLTGPHRFPWVRRLLVRRSVSDPSQLKAYLCWTPADGPLEQLVMVAGTRWTIESCIEEAKGEVGLDHYEVRTWSAWYRHMTMALLAHNFLTVLRATGGDLAGDAGQGGGLRPVAESSLKDFKLRRGLSCA